MDQMETKSHSSLFEVNDEDMDIEDQIGDAGN